MAFPIKRTYNTSKEQMYQLIEEVIEADGVRKIGEQKRLGLMSVNVGKEHLVYLHIVEKAGGTEVAINAGLSYMKDRDQSDLPVTIINSLFKKIDDKLQK